METQHYITPTKKQPIFAACNDYFGYIEPGIYKPFKIETPHGISCGYSVMGLSYADAVNNLHDWIKNNAYTAICDPKSTYTLYMVDGRVDKHGEVIYKPLYKISAKNAIKFIIPKDTPMSI